MSPTDAAKILNVPTDASPEQLEAQFHELRSKLEEKIAKAPTPGLKAKYRESLDEITHAFETLALAADSSALPVARKQGAGSKEQGGEPKSGDVGPPLAGVPGSGNPKSKIENRKSGIEFLVVALIAVVLLGAGGWWVMKTRADKAEQDRKAAEAQAEKDRLVAAAMAEKERQAEAERAERVRLAKLGGELGAQLAEAKITWERIERTERDAERDLTELKNSERAQKDVPAGRASELAALVSAHTNFVRWLRDYLPAHRFRIAHAKASELLGANQPDEAAKIAAELPELARSADADIATRRLLIEREVYGTVELVLDHPGDHWVITDSFGRRREGYGSSRVDNVARGPATVEVHRDDWDSLNAAVVVKAGDSKALALPFRSSTINVTANVSGATVHAKETLVGSVPLTLLNHPARTVRFEVRAPRHRTVEVSGVAKGGEKLLLHAQLAPFDDGDILTEMLGVYGAKGTWQCPFNNLTFRVNAEKRRLEWSNGQHSDLILLSEKDRLIAHPRPYMPHPEYYLYTLAPDRLEFRGVVFRNANGVWHRSINNEYPVVPYSPVDWAKYSIHELWTPK